MEPLTKQYDYSGDKRKINDSNLFISNIVNFKNIYLNIKESGTIHNTNYSYENKEYLCDKTFDHYFSVIIDEYSQYIDRDYYRFFKLSNNFNSKTDVIKYSFIELIVISELLDDDKINLDFASGALKKLGLIVGDLKAYSNKNEKGGSDVNHNLLIPNKHTYILPNDSNRIQNNAIVSAFDSLRIQSLEISKFKNDAIFVGFLSKLSKILDCLELKHSNFSLRIRNIKKYKAEGMFITNTNTIILDPRHPDAIIHEIGHFIYENKLSFTLDGSRVFYSRFKKIIKSHRQANKVDFSKKGLIEEYSDDSEVFAYWFEGMVKL